MDIALPWGMKIEHGAGGLAPDLTVRGSRGSVLCALGWTVTLYIEHGDRPEVRQGMVRAYERAREQVGRDFVWGADPDTGEPQEVATTTVGNVRSWPASVFQLFDFQMMFLGARDADDADGFSFVAVSREEEETQLSYLSVSFPLDWAHTHGPEEFVAWVHELCALVGPSHGYAGPAIVAHPAGFDDEAARAIYTLGGRYRGLEIDQPPHHEPYLSQRQAIKGVQWLTVLSDAYEANLGGRQALAHALGPAAQLRPWASPATGTQGVVIRAADLPRLGDLTRQEPMPDYEHVARVLRSIRSVDPAVIWPQGLPGFDFDQAKAWMTRFG